MRTASRRWGSCRPRLPMKSTSRSQRRSTMPLPPCAGWAQNRQIWRRPGRRSIVSLQNGNRASEVIGRIRALIKKAPPRKDDLEINEAILEVIALTRGEVVKNGVSVQTQLAEGLPLIQGDRVQLQQVILNLIINAVEAMSGVSEGSRELLISTGEDASNGVLVAVQDSGPGLTPENFERSVRRILHDQARRHGHGAIDLPFDYRSSRRTDCGRARTCPAAPSFNSRCPCTQTRHRDLTNPQRGDMRIVIVSECESVLPSPGFRSRPRPAHRWIAAFGLEHYAGASRAGITLIVIVG